jgi:hypothetical protein
MMMIMMMRTVILITLPAQALALMASTPSLRASQCGSTIYSSMPYVPVSVAHSRRDTRVVSGCTECSNLPTEAHQL